MQHIPPHTRVIIKSSLQLFIMKEKEFEAQRQTKAEALWFWKHPDWEAVFMEPVWAFG